MKAKSKAKRLARAAKDHVPADEYKRDYSAETREEMVEKGEAMPGGRYPIRNGSDLSDAVQAFGRGNPDDKDKIKAHIKKRARALGLEDRLPDSWKSAAPVTWVPPWEKAVGQLTEVDIAELKQLIREWETGDCGCGKKSQPDLEGSGGESAKDPNEAGEMDEGLTAPGPGPHGEPMLDTADELDDGSDSDADGADDDGAEGKYEPDVYAISGAYLAELADMNEKAGRVLSTNNSNAIRAALDQLVQVLNRAGIAWGEDEGEAPVATKGRRPGRSGYPWGERSNTVVESDDLDDEDDADWDDDDIEDEDVDVDDEDEEDKALLSLADLLSAANLRLSSPV